MRALRQLDHPFVFPGNKTGRPLSNMALLMLLRRMQRAALRQSLDGQQRLAVDLRQEGNAGIDRAVTHAAVDSLADGHRAGAAIAFRAALLGAAAALAAQVFEHGQGRRQVAQLADFAVEDKAHRVHRD